MNHQDGLGVKFEESGDGADGLAAVVHEAHGLEQSTIVVCDADVAGFAMKSGFGTKIAAVASRQFLHEPETGVMPSPLIRRSGVAQAGDELDGGLADRHDGCPMGGCGALLAGFFGFVRLFFFLGTGFGTVNGDHGQVVFGAMGQGHHFRALGQV